MVAASAWVSSWVRSQIVRMTASTSSSVAAMSRCVSMIEPRRSFRAASNSSASFRAVMSKMTPWITHGSPCSSWIGRASSRTHLTVPSSCTIRYS